MQQKHISYEKALKKAMLLCSKSEKCKSDIRKKLYDWKAKKSEHNKIIEELEKMKFIDEQRYTRFYVRDKFKFNKWGKIKIRAMLFEKQISEKLIESTLIEISMADYIKTLNDIIKQKNKSLKEEDRYKRKNKILQFATGRGFELSLILEILEKEN